MRGKGKAGGGAGSTATQGRVQDLVADPHNRRKHNARNIDMIAASLKAVGTARSIVIDENDVVLAGNGVVEAAVKAGIGGVRIIEADGDELIAVRRRGLTADQKRDLAIADNRAGELSEWNPEQLAADMAAGLDLKPFFFEKELRDLLGSAAKHGLTDADDVPKPRQTSIIHGDLFKLGAHRLLCGDCTVEVDVARLMGDERASLTFTDPPYGVSYQGGRNPKSNTPRLKLKSDESPDVYLPALIATRAFCAPDAALYIFFAGTYGAAVYSAVAAAGYMVRGLLVWNKLDAHYGNFMAQYMNKHEPFLYCVQETPPAWYGPTNEVTVWDVKQPAKNEFHPTQKPVELALRAMRNSSAESGIVADWFLGAGSTLIAAEQLGRRCFGMEIDPNYCQVVIDRWEAFTGQRAVRL